MKALKVLAVALLLAVAGCGGSKWDIKSIEAEVQKAQTAKVRQKFPGASCTKVELIATSDPNVFKGVATFSDNTTAAVDIEVDPNTGKMMYSSRDR